jgi:hypothetical protein
MTPKEKADELYVGYWHLTNDSRIAKKCALIAIDEILNFDLKAKNESQFTIERRIEEYWEQVKQEVEKL